MLFKSEHKKLLVPFRIHGFVSTVAIRFHKLAPFIRHRRGILSVMAMLRQLRGGRLRTRLS